MTARPRTHARNPDPAPNAKPREPDAVDAVIERTCRASGVPVVPNDPEAIAETARVLLGEGVS